MIVVSGVKESDKMRVARAIVTALGIGGVCDKEPKCPNYSGSNCAECAAKNYVKFEERGT